MSKRNSIVQKVVAALFVTCICLVQASSSKVSAFAAGYGSANINIDGYYDDWSDKPHSWEYNWDNSQNCWHWGEWLNGVKYTTPEGTYDENVRHKMSLYCDGEYVYLYEKFARIYYDKKMNGNDMEFFIDGVECKFQLNDFDGNQLTNVAKNWGPGVYEVQLVHENGALSSYNVFGGSACYTVHNPEHINDELEIKIPLSEFKRQNDRVNIKDYSTIEYYNYNLMYRKLTCTGTSTGPWIGVTLAGLAVFGIAYLRRK